ncbi:MAG TPA: glycosyl hydrolase [Terracidiphilus sp.]|jgi:hypothetical protein
MFLGYGRRKQLQTGFAVGALFLCALSMLCQQISPPGKSPVLSLEGLRAGFHNPPREARLRCYWWWLNGNTDEATITHDLEEMKAKGFGGALLVDANGANQVGNQSVPAGPTFGSPAWIILFTHALAEADRLGLEITFNITSGWNLGGPAVTPEQASKLLTYARTPVTGGSRVQVKLTAPEVRNGFYKQIAVLAYPLLHGARLVPQPEDRQGDRYTSGQRESGQNTTAHDTARSAQTLRYRSAAAETGFSMNDSSAMLNDGITGPSAQFAADIGFRDTSLQSVQDISSDVAEDGALTWDAPPGDWEILRIGYTDSDARVSTSSGAWQGLAIDYMSREAFTQYWDHAVEPLLAAAKPYKSLRYLATDSWELGGTNWTPKFREQFLRLRGYDPVPWLPVVAGRIVENRAQSTRFLNDLRRTVADLIVSEHYDVFAEKARLHGMGVEAESGGPHGAPIDALETFRNAAVPQTEFWSQNAHRNTDPERFFTKEAASAANIYGQRFVAEEGETSIGPQWSESLATDLKPSFDMAVTEGLNRLVWHEFTSSPANTGLPGQEYFAGTHLNPKVTWWDAGKAFFDYLNRVQFLMQQGHAVDDVLYFYGDHVPNFVRLKADDPAHALPGYDYDVTNEDALLHTIHIEGTQLVGPRGVHWRVLALPRTHRVSVAVLELAERFLRAGGTVVGGTPESVTGNVDQKTQADFRALVQTIWGNCTTASQGRVLGSGTLFCRDDAHAAIVAMHIPPDVEFVTRSGITLDKPPYAASGAGLDYIHRSLGGLDVYFIRNAASSPVEVRAIFRITGESAELWDAVTGEMRGTAVQPESQKRSRVELSLPPFGSTFVVFGKLATVPTQRAALPFRSEPLVLEEGWSLRFEPGRGAPTTSIPLQELKSWTEFPDPGVRFFSGTGKYTATVKAPTLPGGHAVYLHFTGVREIARVRVNGRDAGTVWSLPYTIRVDTLLRPGRNLLEVETTNLWPNRIIGDLQPGNTQRYTHTNITKYTADSPLLPSGLIGTVEWLIE